MNVTRPLFAAPRRMLELSYEGGQPIFGPCQPQHPAFAKTAADQQKPPQARRCHYGKVRIS